MNDSPTPPVSDEYIITTRMLISRIGCTERTIRKYSTNGLLPPGKNRPHTRLVFWTPAQANRLMKRIGCKAEPFGPNDRYDPADAPKALPVAPVGSPHRLVAGCVSHMLQMMIAGSNPATVEAAQCLLDEIAEPLNRRLNGEEGER